MKHDKPVTSAQFSPDGKRVVTASYDKTARIWDAQTGQPLSEPFKHNEGIFGALFCRDGKRIITASSADGIVAVWDMIPVGQSCPEWVLHLAEVTAGQHLSAIGVFTPLGEDPADRLQHINEQLSREPADDPWVIWGKWFLADRSTRTISPFSQVTIPEYNENRRKENTPVPADASHQSLPK